MAVCRTCGRLWPDDHAVCPDDGTRLGPPSAMPHGQGALAPNLQQTQVLSDEDLAPGSLVGEYRIEKKIGEGGMGAVYGAKHPLIGKRAAVKVIKRELSANPEAVDRFVREAQAVNTIGHPNIVDIFAFGVLADGRSYFVMEWLQGESLRERLERPLTYSEAIDYIDTIAKALQAAHEAGVMHRDLKPDNVFLAAVKDDKPTVMLLDFGLAKLSGGGEGGRVEKTRTGMVMGTPLYISPEQAKGAKVDFATDIYALGVMAYEMFTGRVPFLADSAVEIMSLHITQPPRRPTEVMPSLPPDVDQLVLWMMAKDASQRPSLPQVRQRVAALRGLASSQAPVGGSVAPGAWPNATPLPTRPELTPTKMPGHPGSSPPQPATLMPSGVAMSQPPAPRRRIGLWVAVALGVTAASTGIALVAMRSGKTGPQVAATTPGSDTTTLAEPKPAEPKPADPKPADPMAVDPKPADPKPADPTAVDPKPADPKPADPKPVAKLGTVYVKLSGAPGTVYVDGRVVGRGTSSVAVQLAPGDHKIRAEAPRFKGAETTVRVQVGASAKVVLTLKKAGGGVNAVQDPFAE